MRSTRDVLLVGVSGPDGAGKSSLVRRLATLLGERGFPVVTPHGYGCFLCRRFPVPPRVREEGEPGDGRARRATDPERQGSRSRRVHAFLDAAELRIRLSAARLRASARARGKEAVVVTDRGPLDGLVKFDPPLSSAAAGAFRRIAGRYGLTLLVENGPDVETGLDTLRGRGREEAGATDGGPRTTDGGPRTTDGGARTTPSAARTTDSGPRPSDHADGGADPRRHVGVSIHDDVGNPDHRGGGALMVGKVARRLAKDFRVTVVTTGRRAGTEDRDGVRYVRLPVCRAEPRAGEERKCRLLRDSAFLVMPSRHETFGEFPYGLPSQPPGPDIAVLAVPAAARTGPVLPAAEVRDGPP